MSLAREGDGVNPRRSGCLAVRVPDLTFIVRRYTLVVISMKEVPRWAARSGNARGVTLLLSG